MKTFKNLIILGSLVSMISMNVSAAFDWVNFGCKAGGSVIMGSIIGDLLKSIGLGYVAQTGANGVGKIAGSAGNFLGTALTKGLVLCGAYYLQSAKPMYDARAVAATLFTAIDNCDVDAVKEWLKNNTITSGTTDTFLDGNGPLYYTLTKIVALDDNDKTVKSKHSSLRAIFNAIKESTKGTLDDKYRVATKIATTITGATFKDAASSLVSGIDKEQLKYKAVTELTKDCAQTLAVDSRLKRGFNIISNNYSHFLTGLAVLNTLLADNKPATEIKK